MVLTQVQIAESCRVYFWKAFLRCAGSQFVLALLDFYAIHRIISHATWDVLTKGNHAPLVIGTGYNRKAFPWYTAPAKQPERETLTSEAGGCIHHRNGVGIWCNSSSLLWHFVLIVFWWAARLPIFDSLISFFVVAQALHSAMSKPTRRVVKEKHWEVDSEASFRMVCCFSLCHAKTTSLGSSWVFWNGFQPEFLLVSFDFNMNMRCFSRHNISVMFQSESLNLDLPGWRGATVHSMFAACGRVNCFVSNFFLS